MQTAATEKLIKLNGHLSILDRKWNITIFINTRLTVGLLVKN